jgi:probable addiction module antidote protein
MTRVARDAGLSRESLYKALSGERSPEFETILKVTRALGIQLNVSIVDRAPVPSDARLPAPQ